MKKADEEDALGKAVGFWDPAGLTPDGSTEHLAVRCQTELNSRVSLSLTVGCIILEFVRNLPGYLSPPAGLKSAGILNGLGATSEAFAAGWGQIEANSAVCELSQSQAVGTAAAAGDFGLTVTTFSDASATQSKLEQLRSPTVVSL